MKFGAPQGRRALSRDNTGMGIITTQEIIRAAVASAPVFYGPPSPSVGAPEALDDDAGGVL